MRTKITLADVARLSGVSLAAASRVLNDRPGVREDVRQRVIKTAAELGFRPNRSARNLASGRSSVIGLVLRNSTHRLDPYAAALASAIGRHAAAHDLGLMLHLAETEPGVVVNHTLRDGLIDGLIISSVTLGNSWVDDLVSSTLPHVLIGAHPNDPRHPAVDVENFESAVSAVDLLFDSGCERIGIITGRPGRTDATTRLEGYVTAHTRRGLQVDPALVAQGWFTRRSGMEAVEALLDQGVDGIFACNDEMAIGALNVCARRGVRVPADVAIVGFDGTARTEIVSPSLTSFAQPFDAIAAEAVRQLVARIDNGTPPVAASIAPTLILGESTRSPGF